MKKNLKRSPKKQEKSPLVAIRGPITPEQALQLTKRDVTRLGSRTADKVAELLKSEFGFTPEDLISLSFDVELEFDETLNEDAVAA